MGIQGLIPFLDKCSSRVNLTIFSGSCAAVDAYCLLHKGAYTCAEKLARGEKCDAYVYYCMKYVNMLLSYNIKPILVFDGRHLPAKAGTEKKRRESREANRKIAAELLNAGREAEARNHLRRCVDVTHTMASALIQQCNKSNVDCIVAPYEADAQLAYLNLKNIAEIVITEDSDLILFGCSKVIFKLDLQGNGLLVERERLYLSMGIRAENFQFDSFLYMCILSGCDYLPSLPGIGLGKAMKFINKTRDPDIHRALRRLPGYLNMTQLRVSDEYRNAFLHAVATFRYQPVFDPRSRRLVPLTEPPEGEEIPDIVGEHLSSDTAYQLALGNLDPFTLERVNNFDPDCPQQVAAFRRQKWGESSALEHKSIWSRDFVKFQPSKKEDAPLPGTLNQSTFLDVHTLAPEKISVPEAHESVSESDLEAIYSGSQTPTSEQHQVKAVDTPGSDSSTNVPHLGVCSPVKFPQCDSTCVESAAGAATPQSPVLGQRSVHNPFAKGSSSAKSKSSSARKYFSALRFFDQIGKPRDTEPEGEQLVVVSKYFSCGSGEKKINDTDNSFTEDSSNVLKDVSSLQNLVELYSNPPVKEKPATEKTVLSALEEMETHPSAENVSNDTENREEDTDLEDTKHPRVVKTSAFDWKQFACKKAQSTPNLINSQAVKRTFKNPWKKENVNCSRALVLSDNDAYSLPSGSFLAVSSRSSQPPEDKTEETVENILEHSESQNDDVPINSCSSAILDTKGVLLGDQEDLCEEGNKGTEVSSSLSADSGYLSLPNSLESPPKTSVGLEIVRKDSPYFSSHNKGKERSIGLSKAPARRVGLSRSSGGRTNAMKGQQQQSLLANFGFSKKIKLDSS